MKNKSEYLDQLQFLRFLGFCLIFVHHLVWLASSISSFGIFAVNVVDFFILLSGFLYGYLFYEKDIKISFKNIKDFMQKKIKKFYPIYFVTVILFAICYGIPVLIVKHYYVELKPLLIQFFRCIFLIQSWFPSNYFLFNVIGWYISTILFLYFLTIPLLYLLGKIKKYKYSSVIYFLITCLSFLSVVIYCLFTRNTDMQYTHYVFPFSRIGEYICGMSLGYLMHNVCNYIDKKYKKNNTIYLFTIFEILSLGLWIINFFLPYEPWKYRSVHWIIPNVILILIFAIGKGYISKFFRIPFLKYLGDISFECFLIHYVVIYIYKLLFGLGSVSSWIICFIIVVILSVLLHTCNRQISKKKIDV